MNHERVLSERLSAAHRADVPWGAPLPSQDRAATVAVALFGVVALFQLLLALGVPWGAAAWGGQNPGVLPAGFRIGSAVSALVVYPLMIAYILDASRLVRIAWLPGSRRIAMWVLFAFFALGTVMNTITQSPIERIWAPVNLILAICVFLIARRPAD
jgi:hypothetical protein